MFKKLLINAFIFIIEDVLGLGYAALVDQKFSAALEKFKAQLRGEQHV